MTGTYTIEAGHHYCRPRFPYLFHGSSMTRIVRFDPSCIYKGLPDDREPVNKVFGFAELWPGLKSKLGWLTVFTPKEAGTSKPIHHEASARFGWNCDEHGQLWLYGYSYAFGVRETVRICKVPVDCFIECHIKLTPDQYVFKVHYDVFIESGKDSYETFTRTTNRAAAGSRAFGYGLNFYFGGPNPAPHNMKITLSRV